MLKGKVVYVVITGANKSKDVKILLDYLKAEGATCILMPTATSCSIMDLKTVEGYQIKKIIPLTGQTLSTKGFPRKM